MSSSPDDFKDLQRLLALKRHEQPPPGYFYYLTEKVMVRIEQESESLAEHSTWWEWLVARFDARPWLATAYACAISSLLLMGFRVSQIMEAENAEGFATPLARMPDPNNITPAPFLQNHFANPAGLVNFTSSEPIYYEPAPLPFTRHFSVQPAFAD
jgi:hypothetical protein